MTKIGGAGCTLIGIGPCLILFILTVAHSPLKVIILTASGFFWLISLLITSVLWFAFRPIVGHLAPSLVFGVIAQEAMRFGFFKLITKADDGLRLIANNAQTSRLEMATRSVHSRDGGTYQRVPDVDSPQTVPVDQDDAVVSSSPKDVPGRLLNHRIVSYVAGLGYGLMSGIVQLLHLLIAAYGPGIERIYWESKTFFIVASFEIMCVSVMHIFWSVVLFNAFDERKWMYLPLAYGTHLCVSAMSLLNQYSSPWPEIVCLAYTIVALLMALMSYVALRGRLLRSSAGTQPGH